MLRNEQQLKLANGDMCFFPIIMKQQRDITESLENVNLQRRNFCWLETLLFQVAWEVRSSGVASITSNNVFDLFLLGSKMQGVKSMPAWRRPNTQTYVYCFDGTNGMMIAALGCLTNFLPVATMLALVVDSKTWENPLSHTKAQKRLSVSARKTIASQPRLSWIFYFVSRNLLEKWNSLNLKKICAISERSSFWGSPQSALGLCKLFLYCV